MAHFAELDEENVVLRVIVVDDSQLLDENNVEQESIGISFCQSLFGGTWKQTSLNPSFRKHYASVGFTFDEVRDAFIPPSPYPSWTLNETSCFWEPPVQFPSDAVAPRVNGNSYVWNEASLSWDLVNV